MPKQIKRCRLPVPLPVLIYSTDASMRRVYNEVEKLKVDKHLRKEGVYIAPEVR